MWRSGASPFRRVRRALAALLFVLAAANLTGAAVSLEFPARVECGKVLEFALPGVPPVRNPYDPAEICVEAEVTPLSGRRLRVPAFHRIQYDPVFGVPAHRNGWHVRFTPLEAGAHKVRILLSRKGSPPAVHGRGSFAAVPSRRGAFVRRPHPGDSYFRLDDGTPVLLLGRNLAWGRQDNPAAYFEELDRLAAAGGNCVRLWLAPWWLPVEGYGDGLQRGPGRYDQRACALLDAIFARCEKRGIFVILCIEQHGNLRRDGEVSHWPRHPYNRRNGGPCVGPDDFFSDAESRRLFKRKLRYLIARYGAHPALLAWELFNEVEHVRFATGTLADNMPAVLGWHREMARYLRAHDPWQHLVLTSADESLQRELILNGAIDAMQLHVYTDAELAPALGSRVRAAVERYGLPVIVGEFGAKERTGRASLARGIWAATASGAAMALPWHDGFGSLEGVPAALAAIRAMAGEDDWTRQHFRPVTISALRSGDGPAVRLEDVVITPKAPFGDEKASTVRINREGILQGGERLSRFLRPEDDVGKRPAYVLDLDFAQDGKVGVTVHKVSDRAVLDVYVDGKRVGRETLITGPNNTRAKESKWVEEWRIYQDIYDREYTFPVAGGRHRVRVENSGKDWLEVARLRLIGYQRIVETPGRVFALLGEEVSYAWLARWEDARGKAASLVRLRFALPADVGRIYSVRWVDCAGGKTLGESAAKAGRDGLVLRSPPFRDDIAVRVARAD